MSGEPLSIIQGDLITEVTINREVKVHGGSMIGGHSTLNQKTDAITKTSHVMANVRSNLKVQDNVLSSCVHKEASPGSRKCHDNIVTEMKESFKIVHF